MKCEYCGTVLEPGASVCPACGAKCDPVQTPDPAPAAEAPGDVALSGESAQPPPENQKKRRTALIAAAAVVILAALLAVILPKRKPKEPDLRESVSTGQQTLRDPASTDEAATVPRILSAECDYFKLWLPESWEEKIGIETDPDSVRVLHKASVEAGEDGTLFCLGAEEIPTDLENAGFGGMDEPHALAFVEKGGERRMLTLRTFEPSLVTTPALESEYTDMLMYLEGLMGNLETARDVRMSPFDYTWTLGVYCGTATDGVSYKLCLTSFDRNVLLGHLNCYGSGGDSDSSSVIVDMYGDQGVIFREFAEVLTDVGVLRFPDSDAEMSLSADADGANFDTHGFITMDRLDLPEMTYEPGEYVCEADGAVTFCSDPVTDPDPAFVTIPRGEKVEVTEVVRKYEAENPMEMWWGKTVVNDVTGYVPLYYFISLVYSDTDLTKEDQNAVWEKLSGVWLSDENAEEFILFDKDERKIMVGVRDSEASFLGAQKGDMTGAGRYGLVLIPAYMPATGGEEGGGVSNEEMHVIFRVDGTAAHAGRIAWSTDGEEWTVCHYLGPEL